jgi:hypothetical protein
MFGGNPLSMTSESLPAISGSLNIIKVISWAIFAKNVYVWTAIAEPTDITEANVCFFIFTMTEPLETCFRSEIFFIV